MYYIVVMKDAKSGELCAGTYQADNSSSAIKKAILALGDYPDSSVPVAVSHPASKMGNLHGLRKVEPVDPPPPAPFRAAGHSWIKEL